MANRLIEGPAVTLGDEIYEVPDVFEEIQQMLIEDDTNQDTVNEQLVTVYAEASAEGRAAIDEFLAAFCSWKFSSILRTIASKELLTAVGIDVEAQPAQDGG